MKHRAYPAYKPSGMEWLGEIPEHWGIRRLKYSADLINTKIDGAAADLPYTGLEHIESWTGKRISPNGDITSEGQVNLYGRGDVLFGKLRPYLAKAHAAEIDGICTGELLVLRPKAVKQKFLLNYVLNSDFVAIVDSSTYGAKMPRANWEFIGNLPALIPPMHEQQAIASFLDRETARIDALIEKKQRQIELLQEKRTALISHAVTKGLDPNAKMKNSGIEWLGEIPKHWEVRRLKYTADLINQKVNGAESDLPYMGLEHIESWTGKRLGQNGDASSDGQANLYGRGDVLFGKLRPYLAKAHAAKIDGICTGELLVLRPKTVKQKFLLNYVLNPDFVAIVDSSTYGAKMPRANWEFIGNLPALIPPMHEQQAIADFLDRETARIDALIEKVQSSIAMLRKYRTALISAAVTGKIDVRKEVA